jgi:hypothetical protein
MSDRTMFERIFFSNNDDDDMIDFEIETVGDFEEVDEEPPQPGEPEESSP